MNNIDFSQSIFKKNNGNIVKLTMSDFRNQIYIHLRDYQMDGDTGYWYPTKTGYAFVAEEIDGIINALKTASEVFAKYSRKLEFCNENQLEINFEEENS